LTPEKTVRLQLSYGSDVVICLDDCTHIDDTIYAQQESVRRTIDWARRCKKEFQHIIDQKGLSKKERPLLFGVIQGGNSRELRRQCASELINIGFDGFGYGGWPLDRQGNLLIDMIAYTREIIPPEYKMHALGVGHPSNILECVKVGYDLFDSSMPTRDARHGRLYEFTPGAASDLETDWFAYVYVTDKKYIKSDDPVFDECDCLLCSNYSLGYLHHLFKINDGLFMRLATIHNLRFMALLSKRLRAYHRAS